MITVQSNLDIRKLKSNLLSLGMIAKTAAVKPNIVRIVLESKLPPKD